MTRRTGRRHGALVGHSTRVERCTVMYPTWPQRTVPDRTGKDKRKIRGERR
ncbi:MAG TPA: hypothetical protein VE287_04290 [Actinopolymorphaceae bacterium]|jgi:hypothetical protein|nr:hypothetical protein [Actinopolymorphaceae bacterium]